MTSFNLNRSALDFLLTQVNIGIDYSQLVNALDPGGLREVAGSNNNLVGSSVGTPGPLVQGPYTTVGQADQPFLRLSPTSYDPTGPDADYATLGNGAAGNVTDATPRLVSNLIATSFTAGPNANPAAIEAVMDFYGSVPSIADPIAVLPNAGVLGGGRYNTWFVAFGQFFDHGLDFVQKGASGTVTIPIMPDDPLYVDPSDPSYIPGVSNIMQVSRADLANSASDFNPDGTLIAGTTPVYKNNTGLLIDQSQTYGSHESMNAFLREYDASCKPTGRLVTGSGDANGDGVTEGLATWADVKANALKIGVVLTDQDIFDAPMLRVDATGRLLFTPDSTDTWTTAQVIPGPQDPNDPFVRDAGGNVLRTNQAFLIDINPAANPTFMGIVRTPDADGVVNDPAMPDTDPANGWTYDDELLDAHYITGDGRANENYLVTTVHHVFHEEHNFQVENIKTAVLATGDAAFIAQWQSAPGVWDGEKLFQAARLITESEYNHIAIDQYIGTLYGALPEFVSYSSDINMGVSLEFSQAIFRLGHSMLTNTFKVADSSAPSGFIDVPLLEAFLNPTAFADLGPAAITAGLVRVYGNEVDEFVTPALQQSLLGQPLDLATINITRGRDVGLPTHNELRQIIYDGLLQYTNNTNGGALAPYTSWQDYGDHLKHAGTLVNMIAAYARDVGDVWGIEDARAAYLAGTGTLDAIRDAAQALVDAYADGADPNHAVAVEFMEGTPTFNPGTGQWEFSGGDQGFWDVDLWIGGLAERPLFDGPLGTTFSYILLDFAQRQQDGDRFYYLYRTPMGTDLGDEIIANQFGELVSRATGLEHLPGDVFITPDAVFDLSPGTDANDFFDAATHTITYADLTTGPATGGHIVISGNGGNDYMKGGLGDDTIYGDAGNDFLEGSQGNDHLYGGDGDDTIHDDENDDFIDGGAGNDRIFAGPGAIDTVFGGLGNDELHGGDGIDELIGGDGDDAIFGDGDTDVLFGGNGNDFLEGGDSVDEMWGAAGNDWIRGGVGDDHLNGGEGNDLLEGGIGPAANDGDRLTGAGVIDPPFPFAPAPDDTGLDIVSYEDVDIAIIANLETSNANGTGGLLDTYAQIEGLVGSRFNDTLTGAGPDTTTDNGPDNILVGGAGNDVLEGLGGDDILLGDALVVNCELQVDDRAYTTVTQWGEVRPDFDGAGTEPLGFILGDNATAPNAYGNADKVVFSGQFSDYIITAEAGGWYRVVDTRGIDSSLVGDRVKDVELFQFSDGIRTQDQLINLAPEITTNGGNAVTLSVNENTAAGTTVVDIDATDPNPGDTLTWSITGGNAQGLFAINASTGVISLSASPDYEALAALGATSQVLTATVSDGHLADSVQVTVNIADLVEGPTVTGPATLAGSTEDMLRTITAAELLVNASGTGLSVQNLTASSGTLIVNPDGTWTLTPLLNDDTAVTFTYNVVNGTGSTATSATLDLLGMPDFIGNASANTLTGGAAAEQFHGNGGNDTINANGGNDIIFGDAGNDNANGGAGNDIFVATLNDNNDNYNGGADVDTYHLERITANATVNLTLGIATSGQTGTDILSNIENVVGGRGNDTITGNASANRLESGFGNDTLNGAGGNDTLMGGFGADTVDGGAGTDVMTGGLGADTFVFSGNTGLLITIPITTGNTAATRDQITDFQNGSDRIDLSDIDANRTSIIDLTNNTFTFVGQGAFASTTTAAQVRYHFETDANNIAHTIIEGTANSTAGIDFQIDLVGTILLNQTDFIL